VSDLVRREAEVRRTELRADLVADGELPDADGVPAWMHRPGTLRRVASELAATLPERVDRILVAGPGAHVLGAAVSLATGVPFVGAQGDTIPGERVAVVAVDAADAAAVAAANVTVSRHAIWTERSTGAGLFVRNHSSTSSYQKEPS
jgi:hypothetical protein